MILQSVHHSSCIQVLNSRKVGLKSQVLNGSRKSRSTLTLSVLYTVPQKSKFCKMENLIVTVLINMCSLYQLIPQELYAKKTKNMILCNCDYMFSIFSNHRNEGGSFKD